MREYNDYIKYMIHYPKDIEKNLDFNKDIFIKVHVVLDFSRCKHEISIRDMFEQGHSQLKEMFPEFYSTLKYTRIETEFLATNDVTPTKVDYNVEVTVKGKRQYALSKQCMYVVTKRFTEKLGIISIVDVVKVSNVSFATKVLVALKNFFELNT